MADKVSAMPHGGLAAVQQLGHGKAEADGARTLNRVAGGVGEGLGVGGAVDPVVGAEVFDVDLEAEGSEQPQADGRRRSGQQPVPVAMLPVLPSR